MMNVDSINQWADSTPFRPFRIMMSDGQHFDILDSSQAWPGYDSVMVVVPYPAKKNAPAPKTFYLNYPQIVAIEAIEKTAKRS